MLDLLSPGPTAVSRFKSDVRIGSAPVGQGGLTRRLCCIGAAGVCLILGTVLSSWRTGVVTGRSMEPGLPPGSLFVFQRCRATEQSLQPGDVVVLRRGGETWIKRVYATAGDRFWALREQDGGRRYTRPIQAGQQERFSRIARFQSALGHPCEVVELKVPAGKVFIMGDALASRDSRELGPIPESEIVGKVVTAMPGGLTEMPEWVELSFPSRAVFRRYNHPVPPNVSKREAQQRRVQARQQSKARTRSVSAPKVFRGNAA